ncbi:MAG TPA: Gfo/Idh/MocA family oxidoreductase [Candidatus Atribacteria bacterium]|uniref:Gfo/Idh/MocA family oxidoreductase n=1 Tax=Candidatus Sordicultor fermentans TaxID=1953203 RepID=UPI001692249A|nr:Gfo/Idh/MocA family oxidoreductase [Atribacterota bacterium]NLY04654.1 Gfo/Idh/MocA family oxidoreductase [Candidatus Atribacteria bacterium]MDI9607648.1 Gfo/Idh/MocA family oxidoreductase [Atribacterota bacterium]HOA99109.1 Gfo/Idh/MocA family oxidoreductase [Candidatus Atribacteria bacterium]HOQ51007.1 Gfo/Idh/MocA family oxidoreductase [Candidatus Atribacteria bacterium]
MRVGVIGVGYLGQHHARVYSELPGVELVGVVDINKERAKEVAERYFTSAFFDYQDLFGKVDAVSIVVPTVIHRDIAGRFIEQGINILIEKPVTTSLEEARELMEMANKKNVVLQVGHIERFNSAVVELSKIVDHPIFIDCSRMGPYVNRNTDVGVVLDLMIHDIDIVMSIVRDKVVKINASGYPVFSREEDIANAQLVFSNGCIANLTASRITRKKIRRMEVTQLDSFISIDYLEQELAVYKKTSSSFPYLLMEKPPMQKGEPLRLELEHFIKCVRNGEKPLVGLEEGTNALEVALNILEEIKKKHGDS